MRTRRKHIALFAALVLLFSLSTAILAHDVPDLTRDDCTISLTMRYQGKAVPDGSITLYRVANVYEYDGNYTFRLTDEFAVTSLDLENLRLDDPNYSEEIGESLSRYVNEHPTIKGATKPIGSDGTVVFSDLVPGLYLLANYTAFSGSSYYTANPFLVSVPLYDKEKDVYRYDVDATPKIDIDRNLVIPPPGTTTTPDAPGNSTPSEPTSPTAPVRPVLPQTGQLNWPVPALAVLGLCVFSAGWILRFGKRGRHEK